MPKSLHRSGTPSRLAPSLFSLLPFLTLFFFWSFSFASSTYFFILSSSCCVPSLSVLYFYFPFHGYPLFLEKEPFRGSRSPLQLLQPLWGTCMRNCVHVCAKHAACACQSSPRFSIIINIYICNYNVCH